MACNTCNVQDPAILPAAHQSYEREQLSVLQPRVVPVPIAQKFEVTNAPEHTKHTENARILRTVGSHTGSTTLEVKLLKPGGSLS